MSVPRDTLYNHKSGELLNAQVLKNIKESGLERRVAYRVKSGDILGRIAIRNGVTVRQLKKWNHLRSDTIRPGQILYIYKKN
jgi:membrane-bound lytic murein transglycosylase D